MKDTNLCYCPKCGVEATFSESERSGNVYFPGEDIFSKVGEKLYLICRSYMGNKDWILPLMIEEISYKVRPGIKRTWGIYCKEIDSNQSWSFEISELGSRIFFKEEDAKENLQKQIIKDRLDILLKKYDLPSHLDILEDLSEFFTAE